MKNLEKYMDELLEDTDCLNCVCCKLRLGYDPCKNEEDLTKEECDANIELNKKWLKAEYMPKEALYILRGLQDKYEYIKMKDYAVIIYYRPPFEDYYREIDLNDIFKCNLFNFLPYDEKVLIKDVLEQYKDIY